MKFEGSPHSGIDDATNIARIAIKLLSDGCCLNLNEQISVKTNPHDGKVEVRYRPYSSEIPRRKESRKKYSDQNTDEDGKDSDQRTEKYAKDSDIVERMRECVIESDSEPDLEEDGLDDLLSYYQIQKS